MDIDSHHERSTLAPNPHDLLWFSDGSVVLATDLYLFKVHKGVLSMRSSVFKDMFELPNIDGNFGGGIGTGAAQEMYEGLPLVILAGDKGEDVADLLRAVYDPQYHNRDSVNTPLQTVIALLLLSTKYDFKAIRNDVILQISKHAPIGNSKYEPMFFAKDKSLFGVKRVDCPFVLLAAAFKTNASVLLPPLFLSCSHFPMSVILARSLPHECLKMLLMGRDGLIDAFTDRISRLSDELQGGVARGICSARESCLATARFKQLARFIFMCRTFYHHMSGIILARTYLTSVCTKCETYVAGEIEKMRGQVWQDLPELFGCPKWSVLKEELGEITGS